MQYLSNKQIVNLISQQIELATGMLDTLHYEFVDYQLVRSLRRDYYEIEDDLSNVRTKLLKLSDRYDFANKSKLPTEVVKQWEDKS